MEESWCKITNSNSSMFGRVFQIKSENEHNYILIDIDRHIDFEIPKTDCGVNTHDELPIRRDVTLDHDTFLEESSRIPLFDLIEGTIRNFGLNNFKIGTYDEMFANFKEYLTTPAKSSNISTLKSKPRDPYKILYKREKSNGTTENKEFEFERTIAKGTFNNTSIYKDTTSMEKFIVRRSKLFKNWNTEEDKEEIFKSFYENIKHIILYLLIRKKIGDYKFIPKPYYLGIDRIDEGFMKGIEIIMVMELGTNTLRKYIEDNRTNIKLIRKQFLTIYTDLNKLSIFDFRHGDLKCNNIVMSKKSNPLIIDFGYSQFSFMNESGRHILFKSQNTMLANYDKTTYNGYNQIHDMLQLIASVNFIEDFNADILDPLKIFKFIRNENTNILDETNIRKIFIALSDSNEDKPEYKDNLFHIFYNGESFDLTVLNDHPDFNYIDAKISIYIDPHTLAENIGLRPTDYLFESYEKKYLKYKMKYLQLKMKRS